MAMSLNSAIEAYLVINFAPQLSPAGGLGHLISATSLSILLFSMRAMGSSIRSFSTLFEAFQDRKEGTV